jgi:lipopolysaccharide/colanic/teichoic acid biosynthesis glycosyltransferase
VKRAFDILLAFIGLVLSAPIWIVVAVLIKAHDGGPVFFVQERWGRHGRRIRVRKFRTMHDAARTSRSPALQDDPRITPVGRRLRAAGLDELPQLWSILTGDMSFVGPRALAINEHVVDTDGTIRQYHEIPGFRERLAVAPGLTGWTTVYFPKDLPVREKFEQDLKYIEQRNFALDLRLFALSLWISIMGRWESRSRKL